MFYFIFVMFIQVLRGIFIACDPRIEGVVSQPIEIKFDKELENILQSGSYPDFAGDTMFNSASLPTKLYLFTWNVSAIQKARNALENHFRKQTERNEPQYRIFRIGPIVTYNGDDRGDITLINVQSNGFDKFKNPEFDIKARRQTSVAEELTCTADIAKRNDMIYYISMGFTYDTISLISDFGFKESPTNGRLHITFFDLSVKIFLQIKEIDSTGNFRCAARDSVFPPGYTHRAPEFTIKYDLKNIEIAVMQNPTNAPVEEVNAHVDYIKNEIMKNKEAIERRIWAYLLPDFTKYVMRMEHVKHFPEILYYVVQGNPNPIFSFTDLGQERNDFLGFD